MPKGAVCRYFVDVIHKESGNVVFREIGIPKAAKELKISADTLRMKLHKSRVHEADCGKYIVKQVKYVPAKPDTSIIHESLDDIVKEFLRVCRDPKLWKTIDTIYLGEYARRFV